MTLPLALWRSRMVLGSQSQVLALPEECTLRGEPSLGVATFFFFLSGISQVSGIGSKLRGCLNLAEDLVWDYCLKQNSCLETVLCTLSHHRAELQPNYYKDRNGEMEIWRG